MVLGNSSPTVVPQVQSLRYSCVPNEQVLSYLSLVINIFHSVLDFRFLFLSRRVKRQLLGKSMRVSRGWRGGSLLVWIDPSSLGPLDLAEGGMRDALREMGFQMALATSSDMTMICNWAIGKTTSTSRGSACCSNM